MYFFYSETISTCRQQSKVKPVKIRSEMPREAKNAKKKPPALKAPAEIIGNNDEARFSKLSLLKKSFTKYPDRPADAKLEVFDNLYVGRNYEIAFDCPEFTSHCPVTGQPDFGEISIKYVPDKLCIESKSLKIFLFSFRNCDIFHEEAVNLILDSIVKVSQPVRAEVIGAFRPRGGISIKVKANYEKGSEQ